MISKDISNFAVCNQNLVCDNKETKESCAEDCLTTNTNYKPITFWGWIKSMFNKLFN